MTYRVRGQKKSSVLYHNILWPCNDRATPLWMRRLRQCFFNEYSLDAVDEVEDITDFWLLSERDVMEVSNSKMLHNTVHVPREATFRKKSTVEPLVQVKVSADMF